MTPKELNHSYQLNKELFHTYIDDIKQKSESDIFTLINATLIKNPYTSTFPKMFFKNSVVSEYKSSMFLRSTLKFYLRNFYLLASYFITFLLFKIFYNVKGNAVCGLVLDIYVLVDKINAANTFHEPYFEGIYEVFNQSDIPYSILPRLYQNGHNPFKLIKFFKLINQNNQNFIFEFQYLRLYHFVYLFVLIICYPFKTLRLLQQENSDTDKIFNHALLKDIALLNFESFTRYLLGKNIARLQGIKSIYSWSEFQVTERSFNYAIRTFNEKIKLVACQFYLKYETYFSIYVDDLDYDKKTSPHEVLVNGKYDVLKRDKVIYREGVSLRYSNIFRFDGIQEDKNILILGSYLEEDTRFMLNMVPEFDTILFKNHPLVSLNNLGTIPQYIISTNENIYTLFRHTKIVLGTGSGSLAEAVACGISCIVIASYDNLTAHPLVEYGRGEIWDIAFSKDDVATLYNTLLRFRNENTPRIQEIAAWYKDNFFIAPTETNIIQAFDLK